MPILIPTPAELAQLPWHARLAARKQITAVLRMYGQPTATRKRPVPVANIEFGARVRELAKQIEAKS